MCKSKRKNTNIKNCANLKGKKQKCHDNANITGESKYKRKNANIKKCANLKGKR